MFRKRDADPMAKDDDSDLDLQAANLPQIEDIPQVKVVPQVGSAPPVEPSPQVKSIPDVAPAPLERPVSPLDRMAAKPIDLSESKPLSASPKLPPASDAPTMGRADAQANKRLIVGQGIRLSGEISSCDRLVVEGEVEVTLNDTLALEITSSGRFTGGCEVEEADISGVYEGDLTVRNTLFVRGTGRITGTIRYGQLELERGGQIAGNISVLGNDALPNGDAAKVRLAKAPLFGDGKPA